MEQSTQGNLNIYRFSNLAAFEEVEHFITGRAGGYSKGPFQSLNTGFHVGDNDWHVLQNRKKLAQVLKMDLQQFTFASQTHSSNIAIVDASRKGLGSADWESAIANTDGMVTNLKGVCINVQMADCVPVLLYDPQKKVVGAVHAGWRGTLKRVSKAAIKVMTDTYGCCPTHIMAGIGPSNGPCCYVVGEDVKREATKSLPEAEQILSAAPESGKYVFDQWQANLLQLLDCGIPEENIEIAGICSQCQSDSFFSSRKDNGLTGRYTAGIMLR